MASYICFLFCLKAGFCFASSFGASMTLSMTLYCGNRLKSWNTRPKFSCFLRISSDFNLPSLSASNNNSPSSRICPLSALSKKFMHRRRVVFPLPDEPISDTTSPSSMEKLTPFNTSVLPKLLCILFTSNIFNLIHLSTQSNPIFSQFCRRVLSAVR